MVGLENLSMDLGFENFVGLLSSSNFELVARTHARPLESFYFQTESRLSFSFRDQIFPLSLVLEKKNMELNVGKVADHMTRDNCIPTDSVKSSDDYSNLVHNIGFGAYVDSDKTNLTYLVG